MTTTVSKFTWNGDVSRDEQVCRVTTQFQGYDVRRREEEAYYCLKPKVSEVITCNTALNGDEAVVQVVPASWIRNWGAKDVREYRFHAYVVKNKTPDYFYDVFARSLEEPLTARPVTLEGALKTGPANPEDGFWIRTEFEENVKTE